MKLVRCDRCDKQVDVQLATFWSELKHNGVALDLCPHCSVLFDAFMSGINYVNDMTLVQKENEPKESKNESPKEPKKAEAPKAEPPKQKRVDAGKIHALADAGWKIKDIAEDVGCSEQTVRNHLAKGGPND